MGLILSASSFLLIVLETENFVWEIAVCICIVPEKCLEGSVGPFKPRTICLHEQQHSWSWSHAAFLQQQNLSLSAAGQAGLLRSLHQTRMDLPLGNDKRRARPSWLQHLQLLWDPHTLCATDRTDHPPPPPPEKLIEGVAVQQIDSSWRALLVVSSGWCRMTSGSKYATARSRRQRYQSRFVLLPLFYWGILSLRVQGR